LTQLFQNLVGNAIKFRRNGLRPEISIGARAEREDWVIWVRDNGIGIPQDQYERIFKVFQRLHTWQKYPGTGIGLAICKKIVERHGGRIWVESRLGEGSAFYFTIPSA
jgi:signal transduction histidine kinase